MTKSAKYFTMTFEGVLFTKRILELYLSKIFLNQYEDY